MIRAILSRAGQSLGLPSQLSVALDGDVGIGTEAPFGHLHVQTASTGATSVSAGADELVLENSGNTGLMLLSGATSESTINFSANIATPDRGAIKYSQNSALLFMQINGATRLNIDSSGHTYPARAAGDAYGFRTDQLLLFIARGFDARLTALEAG